MRRVLINSDVTTKYSEINMRKKMNLNFSLTPLTMAHGSKYKT